MKRFFMLMVLFAGCGPTRPYTYANVRPSPELPPERQPPLKQLELERNTTPTKEPSFAGRPL
jgi:hypothetical protein